MRGQKRTAPTETVCVAAGALDVVLDPSAATILDPTKATDKIVKTFLSIFNILLMMMALRSTIFCNRHGCVEGKNELGVRFVKWVSASLVPSTRVGPSSMYEVGGRVEAPSAKRCYNN